MKVAGVAPKLTAVNSREARPGDGDGCPAGLRSVVRAEAGDSRCGDVGEG